MAGIYGHLESPPTRALLDATLDALAATVCDNDPRTKEQRRADALRAVVAPRKRAGLPVRLSRIASGERP